MTWELFKDIAADVGRVGLVVVGAFLALFILCVIASFFLNKMKQTPKPGESDKRKRGR